MSKQKPKWEVPTDDGADCVHDQEEEDDDDAGDDHWFSALSEHPSSSFDMVASLHQSNC